MKMKMKELSMLIDELISCGNKLTETAQSLKAYYSVPSPVSEENPKEPEVTDVPKEETRTYKDVEVRAALGQKAKAEDKKYKPLVKALVEKYSTDGTFTGIPADKYTELMTELEGIGNG